MFRVEGERFHDRQGTSSLQAAGPSGPINPLRLRISELGPNGLRGLGSRF